MKIEILGGKDEIGGNKILLEHKDARIFLDFGMSFKQAGRYFSEFLQPRKCAGLSDFFELGLLPDISGLYRGDYLRHMGRKEEKREIDAVFLSHAHADHANYIHFLRFDIPIYCSRVSKTILQCLEETGSNPLSDFITACEAFQFYENKKEKKLRLYNSNGLNLLSIYPNDLREIDKILIRELGIKKEKNKRLMDFISLSNHPVLQN